MGWCDKLGWVDWDEVKGGLECIVKFELGDSGWVG